jgi:tRNA-splicing ligase RtcB (3'-phosphate/5'-hydroxy nucleic acid ligase)
MPILKEINKTKVPVKIWTNDIENEALEQAIVIADRLPVFKHIALMPDVHAGKGVPIGTVLPLVNGISPFAVGSDIGCGMFALKLNLSEIELEQQKKIFSLIRERIPVGHNHRKEAMEWEGFKNAPIASKIVKQELQSASYQLGTLGGGNHFIEFQKGSDGYIWVMVHSGSRNIGKKIADYYNDLCLQYGHVLVKELPYFDMDSSYGLEYYEVMNFALDFARENRHVMHELILMSIEDVLGLVEVLDRVNIHHNYASPERHFGEEIIVHRKGATLASVNTVGIIPGSQGSQSYIVHGLGNSESFMSCSHGAGRVLSRNKAKKELDLEVCNKRMQDMGLLCDFSRGNLDEAAEAYKDITKVMDNQTDLVDILVELTPYQISAIKG